MARLTNFGSIIEKMTDRSKMVANVQTVFNCTGMKKLDIRIDKMRIVIDDLMIVEPKFTILVTLSPNTELEEWQVTLRPLF